MKRISCLLFFFLLIVSNSAKASPLLFSQTTIDLSSLAFTTTGDLEIFVGDFSLTQAPQIYGVGSCDIWLSDDEFGTSAAIFMDDIEPYPGDLMHWTARAEIGASVSAAFTTSGTGYLTTSFDYQWVYYEQPWARTDDLMKGTDQNITYLNVKNLTSGIGNTIGSQHDSLLDPILQNRTGTTNEVFFEDGATGTITINLWSAAGGFYIEKPQPALVPVPPPLVLMGSALIGLFGFRIKHSKRKNGCV